MECNQPKDCTNDQVVIYDTVVDTIVLPSIVYVPKPVYRDTGSTQWRRFPVDTFQILSNYFARFAYCDTIQFDSNAIIIINDTISQNRITFRKPQITLFPKSIHETSFIEVSSPIRRSLSLGFIIGRNPNQFSFAPSLIYQSRVRSSFIFSYDVLSGDVYIGIYWKLWR